MFCISHIHAKFLNCSLGIGFLLWMSAGSLAAVGARGKGSRGSKDATTSTMASRYGEILQQHSIVLRCTSANSTETLGLERTCCPRVNGEFPPRGIRRNTIEALENASQSRSG